MHLPEQQHQHTKYNVNRSEKSAINDRAENSVSLLPFKCKVAAMMNVLEKLKENFTAEALRECDGVALSVRLDYVEYVSNTFDLAQSVLEENNCSGFDVRTNFTSLYFDVKAKLIRNINAIHLLDSNQCSSTLYQLSHHEYPSSNTSMLRRNSVPEIQLPKFRGSYSECPKILNSNNVQVAAASSFPIKDVQPQSNSTMGFGHPNHLAAIESNIENYTKFINKPNNIFHCPVTESHKIIQMASTKNMVFTNTKNSRYLTKRISQLRREKVYDLLSQSQTSYSDGTKKHKPIYPAADKLWKFLVDGKVVVAARKKVKRRPTVRRNYKKRRNKVIPNKKLAKKNKGKVCIVTHKDSKHNDY